MGMAGIESSGSTRDVSLSRRLSNVRGTRPRSGSTIGLVIAITSVTLLLASSCSRPGAERPRNDLVTFANSDDDFIISAPGATMCLFDYRSQVTALDPADGTVEWVRDIPWSPYGPATWNDGLLLTAGRSINEESYSISALSQSNGTAVWQRFLGREIGPWGQPLAVGSVIVTTRGPKMVALDTTTGVTRWELDVGEGTGLIAHGKSVLARGEDGLISVDATTGDVQWTVDGGESGMAGPFDVTDSGIALIVHPEDGLLGIDPDSGDVMWSYRSPDATTLSPEVYLSDEIAVVTDWSGNGEGGHVTGVDTTTGSQLWSQPITEHNERLVIGGDVLIEVSNRLVIALNMSRGEELWRFDGSWISTVSVPDDGLVMIQDRGSYVSKQSTMHLLDAATGEVEWSTELDALLTSEVTNIRGNLVLGLAKDDQPVGDGENDPADKGAVVALDRTDGSVRWRTEIRDAVTAPPAMIDGRLIATSADVALFCD